MESGATRTSTAEAVFAFPFRLGAAAEDYPAGSYIVDTDEAVHEGNELTIYVRVATILRIETDGTTRYREIDPADLAAALARDAVRSAQPG